MCNRRTAKGLGTDPVAPARPAVAAALASGLGYVLWYFALRGLTATGAATVQLTVPLIAAVGGVLFLWEAVTVRLALASILVLGGVAAVLRGSPQT